MAGSEAAASEILKRTSQHVEVLSDARTKLTAFFSISLGEKEGEDDQAGQDTKAGEIEGGALVA
jgi:hypothetical protein